MQGLQVFDGKGRCTFDMTKRLTRLIGKIPMGNEGAFLVPNKKEGRRIWAYATGGTQGAYSVWVEGDVIKWQRISDISSVVVDGWDVTNTGKTAINGQGIENYIYYGDY
ncbi:MAG: hypothetical protein KH274_02675 [Veillonella sp. oral taxon 780]|nr:hypothetical protein [Veillonella sp. oral taxon 780]